MNLVEIKYVGGTPAVEVDLDGLGDTLVVYGQVVKAAPEIAASLLEQPANWTKPEPEKPSAKEASK